MPDRTNEELRRDLALYENLQRERERSDRLYAVKLVERIVFAACALILVAVLSGLVALVVTK